MPTFFVEFGARTKLVKYSLNNDVNLFTALKNAVDLVLKSDGQLKSLASQPYFLKYFYSGKTPATIVEVDESTEVADIDIAYPLQFILQKNVDLVIPCAEGAVPVSTPARIPSNSHGSVVQSEQEYLKSIGMSTDPPEPTITPFASTSSPPSRNENDKENTRPPASRTEAIKGNTNNTQRLGGKKRKAVQEDDDPIGEYEQRILLKRKRNADFLMSNSIKSAAQSVPKVTKKRKTPANKKATTIEIRVMPSRKAKGKKSSVVDIDNEDDFNENSTPQPQGEEASQLTGDVPRQDASEQHVAPLTSAQTEKSVVRKPVLRWSQKKTPDIIGRAVTRFTPLSPLPPDLEEELKMGRLDIRKVNSYLHKHCLKLTKRDPIRGEYAILAEQFTNKMDCIGILNAASFTNRIRLSLSSSVRAKKVYLTIIKPRRNAKKKNKTVQIDQIELDADADVSAQEEQEEERADKLLQRQVVDKETVKRAISSSINRIGYFQTHSVKDIMNTYPYLHHCDLLIFEYSTRVPIILENLQSNFDKSLVPVAQILGRDAPDNELEKVELFQAVESYFADDNNKDIYPAVQLWDTSVKAVHPLNNIPKDQAPAIVVLKSFDALQSVNLSFDGEKIATLSNPTAFDCISLLIGAYYVFNCEFPSAYANNLLVTEAILHGSVQSALRACGTDQRRLEFLQKLSTALLV